MAAKEAGWRMAINQAAERKVTAVSRDLGNSDAEIIRMNGTEAGKV